MKQTEEEKIVVFLMNHEKTIQSPLPNTHRVALYIYYIYIELVLYINSIYLCQHHNLNETIIKTPKKTTIGVFAVCLQEKQTYHTF